MFNDYNDKYFYILRCLERLVIEEIKAIPDFTGYYASSEGNIYTSIQQGCRDRFNTQKRIPLKLLNERPTKNGYKRVYMRRDSTNKREDIYIHRIIAQLFVPNPNNLPEVNHLDCNRENNKSNNLMWVSRIENWKYALDCGYMKRNKLGQFCHK